MTTENVDVVVTERGARVVAQNIREIGQASQSSAASLNILQSNVQYLTSVLQGMAAAFSVAKIIEINDSWIEQSNRLKQVTVSTSQLNAIQDELFRISQKTGTALKDNMNIYTELALGARQYGASATQVINMTRTLAQAMDASERKGSEVSGAIVQLARAMQQGELSGRGLITLFEQMPVLTDVFSKALRVAPRDLDIALKSGQLSAQKMIQILQHQSAVAAASAATVDTVGDAWTRVGNSLSRSIGRLDEATGASRQLISTLDLLANNMDTVVKIGVPLLSLFVGLPIAITGARIAFAAVVTGVGLLTGTISTLVSIIAAVSAALVAIVTSPITLVIAGLTALGAAIATAIFGWEKLKTTVVGWANTVWGYIKDFAGKAVDGFKSVTSSADDTSKAATNVGVSVQKMGSTFAPNFGPIAGAIDGAKNSIKDFLKAFDLSDNIQKSEVTIMTWAYNAKTATYDVTYSVRNLVSGLNEMRTVSGITGDTLEKALKKSGQAARSTLDDIHVMGDAITWLSKKAESASFNISVPTNREEWDKLVAWQNQTIDALKDAAKWIGANLFVPGNVFRGSANFGPAAGNNPMPKFATGGQFTVGGMGGTDSQTISFKASPGERVTVETPMQVKQNMRRYSSPDEFARSTLRQAANNNQRPPINVQMTVVATDADSFRNNERQIMLKLNSRLQRVQEQLG